MKHDETDFAHDVDFFILVILVYMNDSLQISPS